MYYTNPILRLFSVGMFILQAFIRGFFGTPDHPYENPAPQCLSRTFCWRVAWFDSFPYFDYCARVYYRPILVVEQLLSVVFRVLSPLSLVQVSN
ncbi:hypothetical protein OPQ81_007085 [Rhizoctonia solani]|nr:hypothetical protein OPQ81_007085 [Rhizoctonia solani]